MLSAKGGDSARLEKACRVEQGFVSTVGSISPTSFFLSLCPPQKMNFGLSLRTTKSGLPNRLFFISNIRMEAGWSVLPFSAISFLLWNSGGVIQIQ